ncbi:MAG: hypothetical protein VX479_05700, partial [Verrucomicrobiota bacterium]|nr:hypothetical protein [Verrucomicrobiota bacterium]
RRGQWPQDRDRCPDRGKRQPARSTLKPETTASACSMELAQVKQQLEQCQAQAQAPFLTEWNYSPEQGWLYTNAEFFPFIYSESPGDWLLYEIGSSSPRTFFNYKDNQWQSW